jgi:hypothetical protein
MEHHPTSPTTLLAGLDPISSSSATVNDPSLPEHHLIIAT